MDARAFDEMATFLDRMTHARREIAIAKLVEFDAQATGIAAELPKQWHARAIEALYDIALANGLTETHGADMIEGILQARFCHA
jgi:hypothetical protein